MATLGRVRAVWSGSGVVGPGVSTFYSSNSDPSVLAAAIRAFFLSGNGLFPTTVTIAVQSAGETIDESTGDVNGVWSGAALAPVVGASTANYAAGVGARIVWQTAGITRGRRVRGATYLVPMTQVAYGPDGTIDNTTVTNMSASAATLLAADGGSLRIYSRPLPGAGAGGVAHPVTSGAMVDRVSWLRTRRT